MINDKKYQPAPLYTDLSNDRDNGAPFFDPVDPADFPCGKIRFRNHEWAEKVGLKNISDAEWVSYFKNFEPLPENLQRPLAIRYHGHQFRHYNPDIGDGRGFLFAQLRDEQNRLLDLGTKGSGQTPYSRSGDGRLTLKGGFREVLATQMLEALGVYTSKTFSLIETGEDLYRQDEPSPARSSVMVRLSHSHVRFGIFQRLAFEKNAQAIERLVTYCIDNFYPALSPLSGDDRILAFYKQVIIQTAHLAAQWMAAGFVHGVLNTDNMNVTGESFDYGPWRFVPTADPNFTAAYFDQTGLYAFGRQGEAAGWNLAQLGGSLTLLTAPEKLSETLGIYPETYQQAITDKFFARLGLGRKDASKPAQHEADQTKEATVVMDLLKVMAADGAPFEKTLFDFYGGALSKNRIKSSKYNELYENQNFSPLIQRLWEFPPADPDQITKNLDHPYFQLDTPCTMLIDEVETLWSHIDENDDWTPFQAKLEQIAQMRAAYGFESSVWPQNFDA